RIAPRRSVWRRPAWWPWRRSARWRGARRPPGWVAWPTPRLRSSRSPSAPCSPARCSPCSAGGRTERPSGCWPEASSPVRLRRCGASLRAGTSHGARYGRLRPVAGDLVLADAQRDVARQPGEQRSVHGGLFVPCVERRLVQPHGAPAALESGDLRGPAVRRRRERRRLLSHLAAALPGWGHPSGEPELLRALPARRAVHVPVAAALAGRVDRFGGRGARLRADRVDRVVSFAGARRQAVRLRHAAAAVARARVGAARASLGRLRAAGRGDRAVPARSLPARLLLAHRRRTVRALPHVRGVA